MIVLLLVMRMVLELQWLRLIVIQQFTLFISSIFQVDSRWVIKRLRIDRDSLEHHTRDAIVLAKIRSLLVLCHLN